MKRKLCWVFCLLMITHLSRVLYADEASHRAAAEELLEAMQTKQMMSKQMESMRKMIGGFFQMPNVSKEQASEVEARQSKVMDFVYKNMSWDILKPDFVEAYMEVFTESEMKELTSFYKSPIGQKLLEKTPDLTAKTMQVTQKRVMALMPEIQKMASEPSEGTKKDSEKK
ncbi:MAG: DUF2059 domain-containing protein [Acidobacteriia bacterium]|nr:DUF2059 domain-containing protein [Terriglobia bacterium]